MLVWLSVLMVFVDSVQHISCTGTKSLTFVIDDTRSMRDDIDQVRREVDRIADMLLKKTSVVDEMVLITFNDPDVELRKRTRDRDEFKDALDSIDIHNYYNYDCPEYSLSGIEMALYESKPGSFIYVFTDASAKDYKKINKIKDLCQKTQSKVVFVLTGNCHKPNAKSYQVYHEIATASSGLVIEVDKQEVNLIVETVGAFIEGNTNPLTYVKLPPYSKKCVPFTVSDKTENIIVSASGKNVEMWVEGPNVCPEQILWTRNSKILELNKPEPGDYVVHVTSSTFSHVVVYARTNFTFQHGFSETKPKTIKETSRKPIANMENRLSIFIEDPSDSVEIETAEILNIEEQPIGQPLPLHEIGDNFYITDPFISPEFTFKLAVNGRYIDTGKPIRSLAKTPINPEVVEMPDNTKPTVTISEGDTTMAILGSALVLTCKVHAYPKPIITWTDKHRNRMLTRTEIVEEPYEFISYLNLTSVKNTNKYYCKAVNKFGQDKKSINIKIGDPFKVAFHPEEKTLIKYAETASLKCAITSDAEMKINWYYNGGYGTHKLHTSADYSISADGTELVIKSMRQALVGKYTCNAALLSDDYVHKKITTDVEMYGFDIPIISNLVSFLSVQDSNPVTIPCLLIQGLPKPTIQWQFRTKGTFVDVDTTEGIQITDDGLHIPHSQLQNNGQYKCIAENDVGNDEHITTLTVNKKPENRIIEGTEIKIKYGAGAEIECKTTGHPLPKIEWRYENETITGDFTTDAPIRHQFDQSLTLILTNVKKSQTIYCYSINTQGEDIKAIDVIVEQPFKVITQPERSMNVSYGEEVSIPCEIKSDLPMEITWFYTDDKTGVATKIAHSDTFNILLNGAVLKINSMDINVVGKYTCKASLLSNQDENTSFDTDLHIQGLKKPRIEQNANALRVMDNSSVVIECRILEGHPKPIITWQFQDRRSRFFKPMMETGEVLRIPNADPDSSGQYKCIAENVMGQDIKITELLVEKAPVVKIIEGRNITLPYGAYLILTCEVVGYPIPKVTWTEGGGSVLLTKTPLENIEYVSKHAIKISKMKKSARFSCIASNNLGEALQSIDVTVGSPFEIEEKPEPKVDVNYGTAHTIKCHIKSSLNMKIDWYRIPETKGMRRKIKSSDKYSISSDGTELTIAFMEPNLDGTYRCTASLIDIDEERTSFNTKIKTIGLASPEIDKTNDKLIVKAKSDAVISCRLEKGSPIPFIKWYFKSDPTSDLRPLVENGEVLHISNVTLYDTGHYLCIAENILGKDQHDTELMVEAPPKIIYYNETTVYTAIFGDVVLRIPCNVSGYPKPTISWNIDGLEIMPGSKYSIVDGALLVRTPVENDTLEYTCVAKNSEGEDSVKFDGIVTSGIYDYENVHYIDVLQGSSAKINCLLPHSETDKLRWFLEEDVMNNTESYIDLKDASVSMDGNYSCRVSNENGYSMDTYVVNVGYPPSFQSYQEENFDWEGDGSLDCDVDAKPNVTVQWFYEGELIKTNENEMQLPVTDWGTYKCKVSNVHGSVYRSYNVTSLGCLINRKKESGTTPLLLTENLKWPQYKTNKEFLVIPHKDKLILSCYSYDLSNSFNLIPNKTKVEVTCAGKDTFWIDGKIYKYSDLHCNHEVMPVVKRTREKCLNDDTEMIHVGYELDEFVTVYETCLDTKNNVSLFSHLNMMDTNNLATPLVFEWLDPPGINLDNDVYTCNTLTSSCCISKEQLTSFKDVTFGPAMRSTYIEGLNSVPIWQNCNNRMSWRQLEELIREQFIMNPQFGVWSGASNYIKTDKGQVPQYLWKVARFDEDNSLAIIYVNDPQPTDSQVLCKNLCPPGGTSWVQTHDKYTYCCNLTDFLAAFNIPEEAVGGI